MTEKVLARLAAVKTPPDMKWPPRLAFNDNDTEVQAVASTDNQGWPLVTVYVGLLRLAVKDKPDRLAFVVGHELGHHILGHVGKDKPTDFKRATFGRQQELDADRFGVEWALRAGYSPRDILGFFKIMNDTNKYSPAEGLGFDHPSWSERAEAIDKDQGSLWRAMGAFDSGVYFLRAEQYQLAERCFRRVTKEFNRSHEAWANLGYALLMQYADALEPDDLRKFAIGQILVGGFYRRASTLESAVRGPNEDLWFEAVEALRQALQLKPDLTLAAANLGVAYLIRPAGRDAAKAAQYLEQAAALLPNDKTLDPVTRVVVTINLAVAHGAAGSPARLASELDEAEAALRKAGAGGVDTGTAGPAIRYNRALSLADNPAPGQKQAALAEFRSYLKAAPPESVWWKLAYDRYSQLSATLGSKVEERSTFVNSASAGLRPVSQIELGGKPGAVGDLLADVQKRVAGGEIVPAIPGTNLVSLYYRAQGIRLVANDRILAIVELEETAPAVSLRGSGLGSKVETLKVGMSKEDLERLITDTPDYGTFLNPDINYRFYPRLGLAVRVVQGHIKELVVMQIPRSSSL